MSSKIITQFRRIFDRQMLNDGFVWKHNIYMHICFEQGWFAEVHVRSFASGYDFKVVCSVGLLPQLTADVLKNYHLFDEPSIGHKFDSFSNLPEDLQSKAWRIDDGCGYPEHYDTLPTSCDFFQYTLEKYQETVRPLFCDIHNLYDAYRFIEQYFDLPMFSLNRVHMLINALLSIDRSAEAIKLITYLHDKYSKRKNTSTKRLHTELEELREIDRTKQNLLKREDQFHYAAVKQRVKACQYDLEKLQYALDQLDDIEMDIRNGNVSDRIAAYRVDNEAATARLMRSFTKEERERMVNNWRK